MSHLSSNSGQPPPSGTVTFLFTDIEGSTKLARGQPNTWEDLRARHHAILRAAIESNHGFIFQIIGDAFCAAFYTAGDAVRAAVKSQVDLMLEDWGDTPVRVRMGIHTGRAEFQADGEYHGYLAMSRVQRLMSVGHGGQVLISAATQELLLEDLPENVSLRDLGERRLKDLIRPEHIYQLVIPGLPVEFPPLKTLDLYRHNLPVQLTSFIGREKEMEEIEQAIKQHRLITLTGVGGTGKTRLALQVAADLLDQFSDAVWFVELAPLSNPDLIPQAILSALGIPEQPGLTSLQLLLDYLREKKLLILLDNCEHLIQPCASVANTLLSKNPTLIILATSREALGIPGEMIWHVPSLSFPDVQQLPSIEQLSQYEAVQLFIERAALVQPHFDVTKENAPAIAQICFRLDGIPLAVELAAARVRSLSVAEIAKRLDDRFRLLTGGSRTALERHQTLRATIDWSYNLLSMDEKRLLSRLSVFAGGWTLEAAEQVCSQEGSDFDAFELLARLVDKSLVILDGSRYHLLETTRQYSREKLFESDESETLRDRHLAYFLGLAEQNNELFKETNQAEVLELLDAERGNFRTALEWGLSNKKTEFVLHLLLGTMPWYSEIDSWFDKVHALPDVSDYPELYGRLLNMMGYDFSLRGDFRRAQIILEESQEIWSKLGVDGEQGLAEALEILGDTALFCEEDTKMAQSLFEQSFGLYQKHGDKGGMAEIAGDLGNLAFVQGNYLEAEEQHRKSLAMFQELGDRGQMAKAHHWLAELARFLGDYERAGTYWEQMLEIFREFRSHDNPNFAWPLLGLGWVSLHGDEYGKARILFGESLKLSKDMNNKDLITLGLAGFASLLAMTGKPAQAAQLFGAVGFLRQSIIRMTPSDQKDFDHYVSVVHEQLDAAAFSNAWVKGRAMTMKQAIAFALEESNE